MMRMWQISPEKRSDPNAIQNLTILSENDRKIISYFSTGRENAEKTMSENLLCCTNYVKNVETVEPERLGITGFCLGGGMAYQLATVYPFNSVVPFYGANPRPPEAIANINGPIF